MSHTYGYVRVSSKDQNETRQLLALKEHGLSRRQIFVDKQSGKDFDRPAWYRMMERLDAGDLLVVKSIDRLGRDYTEILEQWREITKVRQADILVLDMPLLDTRIRGRDLTGTFIADLVLQILSYVAQTEREAIKQRQAEGIAAARARGVRFGRPPKDRGEDYPVLHQLWREQKISANMASKRLGITCQTFLAWARADMAAE